ncbi:hypothetical protein GCM10007170_15440 [Arthrobacter liuii]|uniref:Uncharacterized protein n=1 Tax=Arthrobacter liuii TaxID=1476996 RepID=A0ABQ2AM34_9MICC|nr:hypothetical protein GCM10007170_15440 [Arthrobacter liuii]
MKGGKAMDCCDEREPGEHCRSCEYWDGLEYDEYCCNCPLEDE